MTRWLGLFLFWSSLAGAGAREIAALKQCIAETMGIEMMAAEGQAASPGEDAAPPVSEIQKAINADLAARKYDPAVAVPFAQAYRIGLDLPERGLFYGIHSGREPAIRAQIAEVVKFLARFHVDMGGHNEGLFAIKEVILTPRALNGKWFGYYSLEGNRLTIGIPSWFGVGYRAPISAAQLRAAWNQGRMFSYFSRVRARWEYLNPVGQYRNPLRLAMHQTRTRLLARIRAMESGGADGATVAAAEPELVDPSLLDANVSARLASLSKIQMKRVFAHWMTQLARPELPDMIQDHALLAGLMETAPRDYKTLVLGLITITNFKSIRVKVRLGYQRFVRVSPLGPVNESTIVGLLLAIHLIDDVDVTFDFTPSLGTAALEDALHQAMAEGV